MRFDAKEFGGRIRDLRKKQGITQEQLSIMLDVSANHLAKVETGSRCCYISAGKVSEPYTLPGGCAARVLEVELNFERARSKFEMIRYKEIF